MILHVDDVVAESRMHLEDGCIVGGSDAVDDDDGVDGGTLGVQQATERRWTAVVGSDASPAISWVGGRSTGSRQARGRRRIGRKEGDHFFSLSDPGAATGVTEGRSDCRR